MTFRVLAVLQSARDFVAILLREQSWDGNTANFREIVIHSFASLAIANGQCPIWYCNVETAALTDLQNFTVLDIVPRLVFYLKHDVSETGFCLVGKTERATSLVLSIGAIWVGITWRRRQDPVSEFKWKTGRWIMSRIVIIIVIYLRHKLVDPRNLFRAVLDVEINCTPFSLNLRDGSQKRIMRIHNQLLLYLWSGGALNVCII
jgi:hypothetical protein